MHNIKDISAQTAVLALNGVGHTYSTPLGADLVVLRNINLAVAAGQVMVLCGPSGSGKTTLLHIAGLLDTPTKGQAHVCGHAPKTESERTQVRRSYMGFVYQFHHLLRDFSALENVMMGARIAGISTKNAKIQAQSALESVGIAEYGHHLPQALSGGQQQRAAIARALIHQPRVLLADEPTGNLDEHAAIMVFELIYQTAKKNNMGVLMVTHNMGLAQKADSIVHLHQGEVVVR